MLMSVGGFRINLVTVGIHSQRNVGISPFERVYLSLCVWILMHVYVHHVQVPSGTWEGHQIFCVTEIARGTWILGAKEQQIFTPFLTSLLLSMYTSWWKFQSEHDYIASRQSRNRSQCTSSCSSCPDGELSGWPLTPQRCCASCCSGWFLPPCLAVSLSIHLYGFPLLCAIQSLDSISLSSSL